MAVTIESARASVTELYIAAFNRVPDTAGLAYWTDLVVKGTLTVNQVAQTFTGTPEYQSKYPTFLTNGEYVDRIYLNVFGRAADTAGKAFWVGHLDAGTLTWGTVMQAMLDSAHVDPANTDGIRLTNQATYGVYCATNNIDVTKGTTYLNTITSDPATVTAAQTQANAGQTYALTTGVDTIIGTVGNDTVNGQLGGIATFTPLDSIDGAAGTNILNINDVGGAGVVPGGVTVKNIQTLNLASSGNVGAAGAGKGFDTSAWTGLTAFNIANGAEIYAKAATTTDITVSGATDLIQIDGGKNISVTDATVNKNITIGGTTAAAGTITVTDSKQGTGIIAVDGGTAVTVTSTVTADTAAVVAGAITVGGTLATKPSGAIAVTQNLNSNGVGGDLTAGAITVTGGSSVNVTRTAVSTAKDQTSDNDIVAGGVTVTSGGSTTDVTVTQTGTATTFTKAAVAVVKESSVVTFKSMKSGETLIINGLTFTAAKDLTAEQTAQAFASLTAADTQSATGPTGNGIYTGSFTGVGSVWTSAAASGATVTFTATDQDQADLTFTGTATTNDAGARIPTQVITPGAAAVPAVTSTNTVTLGAVRVDDLLAAESIKTITLNGYNGADLGVTGADLKALTTLSLANSKGAAALATTATTLGLTLNNVANALDISSASAGVATLNVTTTGADSAFALTAAHVANLTVDGTKALNLTGSTLTALNKVVVKGSAGLNLGAVTTATSIDTTATTGAVTAKLDASAATYTGGAGNDTLTLTANAITKAIDLGAGTNTLTLNADSTVLPTVDVKSGAGTADVVSMTFVSAQAYDDNTAFATKVTGFERLTISNAASATDTLNTANLGYSYITTTGTGANVLTLDKMANNSTVELKGAGSVTVAIKDALTGTADVLNVISNHATPGTLTAANVETVNITSSTATTVPLTLVATSATTVDIGGTKALNLTMTGNTKTTLIDGSDMSGALTVTSANTTTSTTIKGGSDADVLTSNATSSAADKLYGYAGNDTLTGNKGLTELYGGTGNDTFKIAVASLNLNSASTIMDAAAGDKIEFTGATAFKHAQVTLDPAGNPNLTSYADAAIASIAINEMAWFQYNGNTYIVSEKSAADAPDIFVNGTDMIVKLVGLVDLGTGASYNATSNILELC